MREGLLELLLQIALLAIYGIGAVLASLVGLFIEYQSYLQITAGEYQLAAWMAVIGAVVLYFGYQLFREKFLKTLTGTV